MYCFHIFTNFLSIFKKLAITNYNIKISNYDNEEEDLENQKKNSIIEITPDFEGQILTCQSYLVKLKRNIEKIQALKEKHNKTVAPNKEKGFGMKNKNLIHS